MTKHSNTKTVLVTGASSGIGHGVAIAFGEKGANVIVNYHRDEAGAQHTLSEIEKRGGKGVIFKANISNESEVLAMYEKMAEMYGGLDILINNAGIQMDSPFAEMTIDQWSTVINVNLTGQFLCAREAIRYFEKKAAINQGTGCKGNIIFISSVHDVIPWAGHVNYASSKGGIDMLMKSLALEVAPKRIRVNCISPGAIATDINKEVWEHEESKKALLKLIPYNRIGMPEDIARVATWLASDDSDYITGTTIYVDGGMTLYPGFVNNG
ncbi:MAG: SDR family oxidoreductase [Sphingobacteriaceae bacterium]